VLGEDKSDTSESNNLETYYSE